MSSLPQILDDDDDVVILLLQKGDTSLHISVRGLRKRITEILLRDPKNGRLLYKPNKAGETPYLLDSSHPKSILTEIFGASEYNNGCIYMTSLILMFSFLI